MAILEIAVAALALVLLVSGVLKIRDPGATMPMLEAVRLPSSPVAVYAVATVEIVVGAGALVFGGPGSALLIGWLFTAFAVVGSVLVRSGSAVPCGCFGRRSASMTPLHVWVDGGAALVAYVAFAVGSPGLYAAGGDRSVVVLTVATAAVLVLAAAIVALLTVVPARLTSARTPSPSALALDGDAGTVPTNQRAGTGVDALHVVEGLTPEGDRALIEAAGSDRVILLAFLTTGCTTCSHFWSVFGDLAADDLPGDRTDLVVVTRGDDAENPARVRELAPADHLVIRSSAAWRDYGVTAGPYFVLLDGRRDLVLGEGTASAWTDVVALVRRAVGAAEPDRMAE